MRTVGGWGKALVIPAVLVLSSASIHAWQAAPALARGAADQTPILLDSETLVTHGVYRPRLALAPDGSPRILYAFGQELRLQTWTDPSWRDRRLTFVGVPYSRDLAVDAAGAAHVAVVDERRGLFHASYDGKGWSDSCVAADASNEADAALALDVQGQPHLVYRDQGTLRYARRADTGWTIETVATGVSSREPAVAIDDDGRPVVAYQAAGDIAVARREADGAWQSAVAIPAGPGYNLELALDGADRMHLALDVLETQDAAVVRHARSTSEGWLTTDLPDLRYTGPFGLAIDASGRPHIAYPSAARTAVMHYAVDLGQAWSTQDLTFGANASILTIEIGLDQAGRGHLASRTRNLATTEFELLYAKLATDRFVPTPAPTHTATDTSTATIASTDAPTDRPSPTVTPSPSGTPTNTPMPATTTPAPAPDLYMPWTANRGG